MMDLVHIWCDDRYRSTVSFSNTPAHAHDLKIKVTDFEILHNILSVIPIIILELNKGSASNQLLS